MTTMEQMQANMLAMERKMQQMEAFAAIKSQSAKPDGDMTLDVMAVSLKLPSFYEDRPEAWFYYAESQFRLRKIVDDQTQFDHIYQSLNTKQAARVESIIVNMPKTGKVLALREKLIKAFGRTQYEKDDELLNHGPLGDMTASEFVSKIETLNKDPATFLRAFVLNKLPAEVRGMLANTEYDSLSDLAEAADRVMKAKKKTVNVISHDRDEDGEIDYVGSRGGRGGQARGRARGSSTTRPAPGASRGRGSCFFHDKHGPAAFKCEGNGCVWASTPLAVNPARSGNAPAGR